jgi:hypothetical protein
MIMRMANLVYERAARRVAISYRSRTGIHLQTSGAAHGHCTVNLMRCKRRAWFNQLLVTDLQHQIASSRRLLRAGQLGR